MNNRLFPFKPVLVETIKEQQKQIAEIVSRVKDLEKLLKK
jgi:hypothetical protein